MTLSELKDFAVLAQWVGLLVTGFAVLWAKVNFTPRADHKASIDKIEDTASKAAAALAVRLTAVEAVAAQCATREQLSSLQADYRELKTRVEAVDERLDDSLPQIRTALTRIEDYLLNGKP
jgi:hypothetical protein